ncbi:hypothetical protein TEA_018386 [Camellia sinensis var. sinensis]|uniref:Legume lectin domain-containing protein n=1 Tax=Camellia sinensis var. sinensis TaxID=542762 RepID=A0A4S4CVX8_CAMSN|nr:hypothetical protein TEA_018386 [Camellia sinensis var. sinensis]
MVSSNLGIDINGMISNDSGWIDYDSAKNELNVSLSLSSTKPSSSILTFQIDLSPIFEDPMYVGFFASIEDMKRAGSSWKQLGVVKTNHIFREGNGCVDRLANGQLTRPVGIVVFVVMPACIVNILASDSQGLAKGCKGTKVHQWGISPMVPTRQGCPYLAAIPQWPFLKNFCKIAKC